ncbi:MAG: dTMP kinase, partial [Minisyncoccia bacterium]
MSSDFVKKAPFIVIDGLDGCGKGTQLKLLSERATLAGHAYTLTREPGGAKLSEAIRELFKSDLGANASALTQFLMMWASRRNYLEQVVWPSLEDNIPVFSDRGDSSTLAYQVFAKNAPELEAEFWRLRNIVFAGIPPTCYIFLDVPPSIARERAVLDESRGELSHFDTKPLEFYGRVNDG